MPNDPLRSLRLVVAFAATHTRGGARPEEGRLYDAAYLTANGPELARAVAAAREALADLDALLVAARCVDAALAVSYIGPEKRGHVSPALNEAWSKLLEALWPDGLACPRCSDENCDGGCALLARSALPAGSEHVEGAEDVARLAARVQQARGSMTPAEFARRDAARKLEAAWLEGQRGTIREALEAAFSAGAEHAASRLRVVANLAADAVADLDEKGGAS